MRRPPIMTLFVALRELRRPLAVLALVFVFANVALPTAAHSFGWSVLCSGLTVALEDEAPADVPHCEWCSAQSVAVATTATPDVVRLRWIAHAVVFHAVPARAARPDACPTARPRGPPPSI